MIFRELCGFGAINSWNELSRVLPVELVHRLSHTYATPADIDLYIGANMERVQGNSCLGETNHCLVSRQFKRLRDADRFFYTRQAEFTPVQLAAIRSQTLASVLCSNADEPRAMLLPREMFKISSQGGANRRFRCDDRRAHSRLDLAAWR